MRRVGGGEGEIEVKEEGEEGNDTRGDQEREREGKERGPKEGIYSIINRT